MPYLSFVYLIHIYLSSLRCQKLFVSNGRWDSAQVGMKELDLNSFALQQVGINQHFILFLH